LNTIGVIFCAIINYIVLKIETSDMLRFYSDYIFY